MSVTLNLSPEREQRLKSFAARQGKREEAIIEAWIDTIPALDSEILPDKETPKKTVPEIHAHLLALGALGHYGDPNLTAEEVARQLREP